MILHFGVHQGRQVAIRAVVDAAAIVRVSWETSLPCGDVILEIPRLNRFVRFSRCLGFLFASETLRIRSQLRATVQRQSLVGIGVWSCQTCVFIKEQESFGLGLDDLEPNATRQLPEEPSCVLCRVILPVGRQPCRWAAKSVARRLGTHAVSQLGWQAAFRRYKFGYLGELGVEFAFCFRPASDLDTQCIRS